MPVAFTRTLRSIEADGGGVWRLALPLALLVFGAWGWWNEVASARVSVAALCAARAEASAAAEYVRRQSELELAALRLAQRMAWEEAGRLAQLAEKNRSAGVGPTASGVPRGRSPAQGRQNTPHLRMAHTAISPSRARIFFPAAKSRPA